MCDSLHRLKSKKSSSMKCWNVSCLVPFDPRSYYSVQTTEWKSYPRYGSSQDLSPLELRPNLYYLNGIEWAGSAMEMSSVAAKNIALLAYHRWNRQADLVDQKDLMHRIKTELWPRRLRAKVFVRSLISVTAFVGAEVNCLDSAFLTWTVKKAAVVFDAVKKDRLKVYVDVNSIRQDGDTERGVTAGVTGVKRQEEEQGEGNKQATFWSLKEPKLSCHVELLSYFV